MNKRFKLEATTILVLFIAMAFTGWLWFGTTQAQRTSGTWPATFDETNTTYKEKTGWGTMFNASAFDLKTVIGATLTDPLSALGLGIAIIGTMLYPNPYVIFAGFVVWFSGFTRMPQNIIDVWQLPSAFSTIIPLMFVAIFLIALWSWYRGGSSP